MFPLPINEEIINTMIEQNKIYQRQLRWTKSNRVGLDLSEVAFVNWNSGGSNSVSGLAEVVIR